MWTSNFTAGRISAFFLKGCGISHFEGGAGGWLAKLVILTKFQVKEFHLQPCHPPRANAKRISSSPLQRGRFNPQYMEG